MAPPEQEKTVCLQCGEVGFENALVYCIRCLKYAVHRYCLDIIPENFDGYVRWFCDDCDEIVRKKSVVKDHNAGGSAVVGTKENDKVVEISEESESDSDEREQCQDTSSLPVEEQKAEDSLQEEGNLSDDISLKEMLKRTVHKQILMKKEKMRDSLPDDKNLANDASLKETNSTRKRKTRQPLKFQDFLLTENLYKRRKKRAVSNRSSKQFVEESTNINTNEMANVECDSKRQATVSMDQSLKSSEKKRTDTSTEAIADKQTSKISTVEDINVTDKEELEDREKTSSPSNSNYSFNDNPEGAGNSFTGPTVLPIWRGSFNIQNKEHNTLDGLVAHMSAKACPKANEAASHFQPVLHLEKVPKSEIWPRSFGPSGPTDECVAVYLFATNTSEDDFDLLVKEMFHEDLALKASLPNAELLIFTSTELPLLYWRFQGKYYLWGVFKKKKSSQSHS